MISARSESPKGTLMTKAGRTFSAIPKSKSQTSPRAGVIFLGFKKRKELVCRVGGFLVVQRTRIEWNDPLQELRCEGPLVLGSECFVSLEEIIRRRAHSFRVAPFPIASKGESKESFFGAEAQRSRSVSDTLE